MIPREPNPCPHATAVLARLLDGDLDAPLRPELTTAASAEAFDQHLGGDGVGTTDALSAHVRHCVVCQQTLQRARRLDAMLARSSGRRLPGGDQVRREQWLQRAVVAHPASPTILTPAAPAARGRGRLWTAGLAALAMVALLLPWPAPASGAEAPQLPAQPTVASADGPALLPLPPGPRRPPPRRASSAVNQPPAPSTVELQRRLATERLPLQDRIAAAHELLQRTRASAPAARTATDALLLTAAGCGDRDASATLLHQQLLAWLQAAPWVLERLVERLQRLDAPGTVLQQIDLASLTVAARLGGEQLDHPLRLLLRRHPDAVTVVCAALRCGSRRDGGAALLLDVWHDLVARDRIADDEHTAQSWFTGQPVVMFAALATEFEASADAPRRRRCLMALAHATDAASCRRLVALLHSPRRDEAHLAAFALSRQPRHHLLPLLTAAAADDAGLLRAALAVAGLPATRPWVEQLALRPRQRQRLAHATAADFVLLANWFRRSSRPTPLDTFPTE